MASHHVVAFRSSVMQLNIGDHIVSTPIQLVIILLGAKQFVDPPEEVVAEGESVIGEATDEERAIFSARRMVGDTTRSLVATLEGESLDDLPKETVLRLETLKSWGEILNKMLWLALDLRLYEQRALLEGNPVNTGIRAGWQVTAFEPTPDPIQNLLGMLFGNQPGVRVVVSGGPCQGD